MDRGRPVSLSGVPTTDGSADRHRSLIGAFHVVSGLTLLSRLGGLARDLITARVFQDTLVGSAFAAAFQIPNLFRRLLGEGALSAAFLPEYASAIRDEPEVAPRLASLTLGLLLLVAGVLTGLIEIVLWLVLALNPENPDRAFAIRLMMVLLPFMPMICASAVMGGMLQVHGRFALPAVAPLLLNLFIIAAGLWHFATAGQPRSTAFIMAGATLVAGGVHVALSAASLRGRVQLRRVISGAGDRTRRMLRRFLPVLIGLGTLQLNTLLDTLIAMWPVWVGASILGHTYPLDASSNAILSYTTRLYQFPLGVFGIAVATAVFPLLSRDAPDAGAFLDTLRRGLRLSLFIALPSSAGLLLVRADLPAVMYGGASGFSDSGIVRSAAVLAAYAPAVWAYSINHVLTRAFYARGDTRTPMRIAVGIVALNLVLNLVLIWPLAEAGLAAATSLSSIAQSIILWRAGRGLIEGRIADAPTIASILRTGVATVGMAAPVAAMLMAWHEPATWTGHLLRLGATCTLGVVLFALAATTLRCPELRWLARRDPG